jgi:hypothetical protein
LQLPCPDPAVVLESNAEQQVGDELGLILPEVVSVVMQVSA